MTYDEIIRNVATVDRDCERKLPKTDAEIMRRLDEHVRETHDGDLANAVGELGHNAARIYRDAWGE